MSKSTFCGGQSSMYQKRCEKNIRAELTNLKLKSKIPSPSPRHRKCYMRVVESTLSQAPHPPSTQIPVPVLQLPSPSEEKSATRAEVKKPPRVLRYPRSSVRAKVDSNRVRLTSVLRSTEKVHHYWYDLSDKGPSVPSAEPVGENVKLDDKNQMTEPDLVETGSEVPSELTTVMSTHVTTEGDPLNSKLQIVIEEHKKLALTLSKVLEHCEGLTYMNLERCERLTDVNLKRAHEREVSTATLRDQLGSLSEENKELDRKCKVLLEKYDQEKRKVAEVKKNMTSMEETVNHLKTKCINLERKERAMKISHQCLGNKMRTTKIVMKMQYKKYESLIKCAEGNISRLESELASSKQTKTSLENANKDLGEDCESTGDICNKSKYNSNELRERLLMKGPELRELKEDLEMTGIKFSNTKDEADSNEMEKSPSNSNEDLDKQLEDQNNKIQELTADLTDLENTLKEKLVTENTLMSQVTGLQRELVGNTKAAKLKVKKLQLLIKSLSEDKAELEKIIAQKCLELGHQEVLMQERLSDIQNPRERVVFRHQKTFYTQGFYTTCGKQNVMKKSKTSEKYLPQDLNMVVKEKEKVNELSSLLEQKQMEVSCLERRLLRLQKGQGKERNARVSSQGCFLAKAFLPKESRRSCN